MNFFVTCPKGLEPVLFDELTALGINDCRQTMAGVSFTAELQDGYRVCLWSRVANRVLLVLQDADGVESADDLYQAVRGVEWLEHLRASGTLSVDFSGQSRAITHSRFGAQKVKDAIVDQIREATGRRPSVDRSRPDLRVNARLHRGKLRICLDLSGDSLHRRGYRLQAGKAPMKENLAAALLYRSQWPDFCQRDEALIDPMCGSGTLLIEAALMAADIAPGILRKDFGFNFWPKHQPAVWNVLLEEARQRKEAGLARVRLRMAGFDADARVLATAQENARRAGVEHLMHFERRELAKLKRPAKLEAGLLLTNPPYGERLGDEPALFFLYQHLGERLKAEFAGWTAGVFTGNPELCKMMKLAADKRYKLYNGALESQLLIFNIRQQTPASADVSSGASTDTGAGVLETGTLSAGAEMFANRVRKNLKQLGKWARRENIECYRIYDADLPEYAVAVDRYGDWLHVQEYAAPKSVDTVKAFERVQEVLKVLPGVLEVPTDKVVLKQRKRQQGMQQYEKQNAREEFTEVLEGGCRILVNLRDYLDTGLFLDHRPVRLQIQQQASGKDVLNLFSYTATASLHAAKGGARSTTSVDMSATYLNWGRKNFALNGFAETRHEFVQADCIKWLKAQKGEHYDLIFMDPPTFSNSKRMQDVLDVQRDHVMLVDQAMALLRPGGKLIFSNNYRRFRLDEGLQQRYQVKDITRQTIGEDFKRNQKIHCCFEFVKPG